MVNYWLARRIERKFKEFQEAVYAHVYLTYGHGRLSALTFEEVSDIIPEITKLRDKYELNVNVRPLVREMMKREKWAKI